RRRSPERIASACRRWPTPMTCPPGRRSGRVREPVAQSRRTRIVVGPSAMFRPVLGRRGPAPPRRGTAAENPPPSPGPLPEPAAELFDPVDLPTPDDPFGLARRTINRSRAAARDRGLFPISAKAQARDVGDRSRGAPGYSGARPDPRDPQGIGLILRRVLSD